MARFKYVGPPDRLFYGPVTATLNPGDELELPDDFAGQHFEALDPPKKPNKPHDSAIDTPKE